MKRKIVIKIIHLFLTLAILLSSSGIAQAATLPYMPEPGQMLAQSVNYDLPYAVGIKFDPADPLKFTFMVDRGQNVLSESLLRREGQKIVRYFLAALTIPEEDLWVNLSPYEASRIVPDKLSVTDLGRDMLGEDYVLKQMAASLTYPETGQGKKYWNEINNPNRSLSEPRPSIHPANRRDTQGAACIETTNFFNKVWIMPGKIHIYEEEGKAYIDKAQLKVMMEEDYLAGRFDTSRSLSAKRIETNGTLSDRATQSFKTHILPLIEKEVNTGKNFAQLRQLYYSIILAGWFKEKLKNSFLNEEYFNKRKVKGVDTADPKAREEIYQEYLEAFKKGAYNYVKKEITGVGVETRFIASGTKKITHRQYFSGGEVLDVRGHFVEVSGIPAGALSGCADLVVKASPVGVQPVSMIDALRQSDAIADIELISDFLKRIDRSTPGSDITPDTDTVIALKRFSCAALRDDGTTKEWRQTFVDTAATLLAQTPQGGDAAMLEATLALFNKQDVVDGNIARKLIYFYELIGLAEVNNAQAKRMMTLIKLKTRLVYDILREAESKIRFKRGDKVVFKCDIAQNIFDEKTIFDTARWLASRSNTPEAMMENLALIANAFGMGTPDRGSLSVFDGVDQLYGAVALGEKFNRPFRHLADGSYGIVAGAESSYGYRNGASAQTVFQALSRSGVLSGPLPSQLQNDLRELVFRVDPVGRATDAIEKFIAGETGEWFSDPVRGQVYEVVRKYLATRFILTQAAVTALCNIVPGTSRSLARRAIISACPWLGTKDLEDLSITRKTDSIACGDMSSAAEAQLRPEMEEVYRLMEDKLVEMGERGMGDNMPLKEKEVTKAAAALGMSGGLSEGNLNGIIDKVRADRNFAMPENIPILFTPTLHGTALYQAVENDEAGGWKNTHAVGHFSVGEGKRIHIPPLSLEEIDPSDWVAIVEEIIAHERGHIEGKEHGDEGMDISARLQKVIDKANARDQERLRKLSRGSLALVKDIGPDKRPLAAARSLTVGQVPPTLMEKVAQHNIILITDFLSQVSALNFKGKVKPGVETKKAVERLCRVVLRVDESTKRWRAAFKAAAEKPLSVGEDNRHKDMRNVIAALIGGHYVFNHDVARCFLYFCDLTGIDQLDSPRAKDIMDLVKINAKDRAFIDKGLVHRPSLMRSTAEKISNENTIFEVTSWLLRRGSAAYAAKKELKRFKRDFGEQLFFTSHPSVHAVVDRLYALASIDLRRGFSHYQEGACPEVIFKELSAGFVDGQPMDEGLQGRLRWLLFRLDHEGAAAFAFFGNDAHGIIFDLAETLEEESGNYDYRNLFVNIAKTAIGEIVSGQDIENVIRLLTAATQKHREIAANPEKFRDALKKYCAAYDASTKVLLPLADDFTRQWEEINAAGGLGFNSKDLHDQMLEESFKILAMLVHSGLPAAQSYIEADVKPRLGNCSMPSLEMLQRFTASAQALAGDIVRHSPFRHPDVDDLELRHGKRAVVKLARMPLRQEPRADVVSLRPPGFATALELAQNFIAAHAAESAEEPVRGAEVVATAMAAVIVVQRETCDDAARALLNDIPGIKDIEEARRLAGTIAAALGLKAFSAPQKYAAQPADGGVNFKNTIGNADVEKRSKTAEVFGINPVSQKNINISGLDFEIIGVNLPR